MAYAADLKVNETAPGTAATIAERLAARLDPPLFRAVTEAEDALARLDERLARSPLREGFSERAHFHDACAALWLAGELVPLEDLVLHDAEMDLRLATHELTRAHEALRARRKISVLPPGALLDRPQALRISTKDVRAPDDVPPAESETLDAEFAAIDAAIARAAKVLRDGVNADPQSDPGRALIYDEEFDEKARFAGWRREIEATDPLPATLAAAIGLEAWRAIAPLEHRDWLGAQLVADLLRHRGKARAHLPALNIGLRAIPRQKRRAATLPGRINANLEAIAAAARQGLEEHDRLTLAKAALERRCRDCRRNARLPALAEFALSRPLVTAPMIAAALKISQRAAQDMAPALGLREITGRSRFRAWAV